MKKYGGQKMNVMIGLIMILIVSVGYLVMQSGRQEGYLTPDNIKAINTSIDIDQKNIDTAITDIISHITTLQRNIQNAIINKTNNDYKYNINIHRQKEQLRKAEQILQSLYKKKQLLIDEIYNKQLNPPPISNNNNNTNASNTMQPNLPKQYVADKQNQR